MFLFTFQILYTKKEDSGVYEAQVGSVPPISITMSLFVVGKLGNISLVYLIKTLGWEIPAKGERMRA